MKKLRCAGAAGLIFTLAVWAVHHFLRPLADWLVRVNGVAMLAFLALTVFGAAKAASQRGR